ncbi:MAG: DUF1761 domain-containing protein [Balneolaceae bacterium]|nr:DUF1761 domain-containing protein [Balneolaceae bacterium]
MALFGKAWMATVGLSEEQIQQGNMAKIFGPAFIFELIMAFNLAMFLTGSPEAVNIDAGMGAFYGFLTGFGWVFFALAVNSLYEQRSWKDKICINGGYWTITFTVMGLIIGINYSVRFRLESC